MRHFRYGQVIVFELNQVRTTVQKENTRWAYGRASEEGEVEEDREKPDGWDRCVRTYYILKVEATSRTRA